MAMLMWVFTACQDAPDADEAEVNAPQDVENTNTGVAYKVNTNQSKITWTGTKPTGQHHGTVMVKSGQLMVQNNNITGGNFVLDMTTIAPYDQDEKGNNKLGTHLKSEDFFDVTKHPEGTFEITSVQAVNGDVKLEGATHNITGNLTLKGTSKSISFPARVNITDQEVRAEADFNINRSEWGVNYGTDKSLGDKMIHEEVNIKLNLVAAK